MNLFLASDRRPVHFVGIGGAGMAALALVALRRGVAVSGSDTDTSGCGDLRTAGAEVREGIHPSMVDQARAVVASAAIAPGHPELARAAELAVPVVPRKVALAELVAGGRTVAIAGTHGKTTSSVMTAGALEAAGFNPTALAGGRVAGWGGNALIGGTECYVVEADEYDQAFLALHPTVAVITNVEPDHLECYGSVEAMEAAFAEFAGRAEWVLVGNDGVGSDRVAAQVGSRVVRFGPGATGVKLTPRDAPPGSAAAAVSWPDGRTVALRLQVPGLHNLRNATGALAAVGALGGDVVRAAEALAQFTGVGRRFERLGEHAGVEWVDDYAHHPTEVRATLAAAREAFPGRRLVAVFQPHLYSRTALHGEALGEALAAADLAVVTDIYPAREAPIPGVTGEVVARATAEAGGEVKYIGTRDDLAATVRPLLQKGDVLLTLGAGDITRLASEFGVR